MKRKVIKAYAKLNLSLNITGIDEQKYHLLDSLVCSIDLYDLVKVTERKDKIVKIRMNGMGLEYLEEEKNNAYISAVNFMNKFMTNGVDIIVFKNIPVGSGMGGSSADAAAVIKAMSQIYNVGEKETFEFATTQGSDTAYMLDGGFARMKGRGEKIEKLDINKKLPLFLICPKTSVSSKDCYKKYDELNEQSNNSDVTEKCIEALKNDDMQNIGDFIFNDLFEGAKALNSDVSLAFEEGKSFSPLAVGMTGSGSCVFCLFEHIDFCSWAQSRYKGKFRTYIVQTVNPKIEKSKKDYYSFKVEEANQD